MLALRVMSLCLAQQMSWHVLLDDAAQPRAAADHRSGLLRLPLSLRAGWRLPRVPLLRMAPAGPGLAASDRVASPLLVRSPLVRSLSRVALDREVLLWEDLQDFHL